MLELVMGCGGGGLSWWREVVNALAGGERWCKLELVLRGGAGMSWW